MVNCVQFSKTRSIVGAEGASEMTIMEKKAILGVQKKRVPTKRTKKKYFLNKIVDYLKSDCYLFAPLASSSRSDFRSHKIEIKEKKKKLLKKVGDYLRSDSHMYAPLVNVPPKPVLYVTTEGPQRYTKHVTVEVLMGSISLKENTKLANQIVEDEASKDPLSEKFIPDRPRFVHRETVKPHAVYQNCLSVSGKGMHGSRLRKLR